MSGWAGAPLRRCTETSGRWLLSSLPLPLVAEIDDCGWGSLLHADECGDETSVRNEAIAESSVSECNLDVLPRSSQLQSAPDCCRKGGLRLERSVAHPHQKKSVLETNRRFEQVG